MRPPSILWFGRPCSSIAVLTTSLIVLTYLFLCPLFVLQFSLFAFSFPSCLIICGAFNTCLEVI